MSWDESKIRSDAVKRSAANPKQPQASQPASAESKLPRISPAPLSLQRPKLSLNAVPRASMADTTPPWQASSPTVHVGIRGGVPRIGLHCVPLNAGGKSALPGSGDPREYQEGRLGAANASIIIIDDRVLVRECLLRCLQMTYVDQIVLAFSTLSAWMEVHADHPPPSVVLFCLQSRRKAGFDSPEDFEFLGRLAASVPVIIVSDSEDGNRIMRAMEGGARGYIPTSMTLDVAIEAVRLVGAGGTFLPAKSLISFRQGPTTANNDFFTARQTMVVQALRQGKANKQIAYELGMRESTVKVHIRHIMQKLKARNRTEVAIMTSGLFERGGQTTPAD